MSILSDSQLKNDLYDRLHHATESLRQPTKAAKKIEKIALEDEDKGSLAASENSRFMRWLSQIAYCIVRPPR